MYIRLSNRSVRQPLFSVVPVLFVSVLSAVRKEVAPRKGQFVRENLRISKKSSIFAAKKETRHLQERLNIRNREDKQQVFCDWRRKWVRLTPEEWVRQHFLHRLVEEYHYPHALIGVEIAIQVGDAKKRCDAIVYNRQMQPVVLVECKAEHVALTQRTLDQAITYNRRLGVPYLFLHNGGQTVVAHTDNQEHEFLNYIPEWSQL